MNAEPSINRPDQVVVRESSPGRRFAFAVKAQTLFLQISHRLGAIAFFATVAVWAQMYRVHDFHLPLAIACGCADAGLCAALCARMLNRPADLRRREADGVAIFNLIFLVLALYLMLFARLEWIRFHVSDFFTPSPTAAVNK